MNRRFVVIAAFLAVSALAASHDQVAQAQITSPSNNSFLTAGANQEISWKVKKDSTSIVTLQYSTDAGYSWNYIASTSIGAGTYEWIIPVGINAYSCEVRIVQFTASGYTTIASTGNFSIAILNPYTSANAVFSHRVVTLTATGKHHINRNQFFK